MDLLQTRYAAFCRKPQVQLPTLPAHSSPITPDLAFEMRDGLVVYFNGHLAVFLHAEGKPKKTEVAIPYGVYAVAVDTVAETWKATRQPYIT